MNNVFITGILTKDAMIAKLSNTDTYVIELSIAVNGFRKDQTFFFDVTFYTKYPEKHERKRGELVAIEGKLKQDTWTDKKGKKVSKVGILANMVYPINFTKKIEANINNKDNDEDEVPF